MKVLDVLEAASTYLNLRDDFDYYFNEDNSTAPSQAIQDEFAVLLKAFNFMVKKIASEFVVLKYSEDVEFVSDSFSISSLTKDVGRILSVKVLNKSKKFWIENGYIKTNFSGQATVKYSYLPQDFASNADFNIFSGYLGITTLALGVLCEYFLIKNNFDAHSVWNQKFEESLKSNLREFGTFVLPKRGWL